MSKLPKQIVKIRKRVKVINVKPQEIESVICPHCGLEWLHVPVGKHCMACGHRLT